MLWFFTLCRIHFSDNKMSGFRNMAKFQLEISMISFDNGTRQIAVKFKHLSQSVIMRYLRQTELKRSRMRY